MKKRFWRILAVFALLLGLCFSMNVLAEYPAVSGSAPLKAYGWQSRDYTVFSDQFLTEKIGTVSYQESVSGGTESKRGMDFPEKAGIQSGI